MRPCDAEPLQRRFRSVRRAQMRPVLSGEIEERQQRVAILEQTVDGLVVFGSIFFAKIITGFGGRAVLGQPDRADPDARWAERTSVACRARSALVLPTPLVAGRGKGFVQGLPEAKRAVAHRDVRRIVRPRAFRSTAVPSSLTLSRMPVCKPRSSFLPLVSRHQDQHAPPAAPCAPADRRRPPRHKHSAGPIDRGLPAPIVVLPRSEPPDHGGRRLGASLPSKAASPPQVAGGNAAQIKRRQRTRGSWSVAPIRQDRRRMADTLSPRRRPTIARLRLATSTGPIPVWIGRTGS